MQNQRREGADRVTEAPMTHNDDFEEGIGLW